MTREHTDFVTAFVTVFLSLIAGTSGSAETSLQLHWSWTTTTTSFLFNSIRSLEKRRRAAVFHPPSDSDLPPSSWWASDLFLTGLSFVTGTDMFIPSMSSSDVGRGINFIRMKILVPLLERKTILSNKRLEWRVIRFTWSGLTRRTTIEHARVNPFGRVTETGLEINEIYTRNEDNKSTSATNDHVHVHVSSLVFFNYWCALKMNLTYLFVAVCSNCSNISFLSVPFLSFYAGCPSWPAPEWH